VTTATLAYARSRFTIAKQPTCERHRRADSRIERAALRGHCGLRQFA